MSELEFKHILSLKGEGSTSHLIFADLHHVLANPELCQQVLAILFDSLTDEDLDDPCTSQRQA